MTATNPIRSEELLTPDRLVNHFPKINGDPISPKLVRKYIHVGIKVRGARVRLESELVGGVRVSSAAAVKRFLDRLNGIAPPTPVNPTQERGLQSVA